MCLENVPEGQLLHDPAPDPALNVPAGHAAQLPPFGPVKPALHAQSEEASLWAGEEDPATMLSRQPPDCTSLGRPSCIKEAACTAYEIRPSRKRSGSLPSTLQRITF